MELPIVSSHSPCPEGWVRDEYLSPCRYQVIGKYHPPRIDQPESDQCLCTRDSFLCAQQAVLGTKLPEVVCDIIVSRFDQDTGARSEVTCPIRAIDAHIDVDMILSYE
jgi:hypothetical protein